MRDSFQKGLRLEFYLVKNNSVTSELISKLDDTLKDISKKSDETNKIKNSDGKEVDNENGKTKQVSENKRYLQTKPGSIEEAVLKTRGLVK